MKWPVVATNAPKPRTKDVVTMSTFYAAILAVLAVAQLFTFEDLLAHMVTLDIPGGRQAAYLVTSGIIISEVLALPFLLRLTLSKDFRVLSMVCGWLVAALWLFVSAWIVTMVPEATTVGYLGTVVETVPGWWAVLIALAFGILAAWASWGMWPFARRKKN